MFADVYEMARLPMGKAISLCQSPPHNAEHPQKVMSALGQKADMYSAQGDVRFVPIADIEVATPGPSSCLRRCDGRPLGYGDHALQYGAQVCGVGCADG